MSIKTYLGCVLLTVFFYASIGAGQDNKESFDDWLNREYKKTVLGANEEQMDEVKKLESRALFLEATPLHNAREGVNPTQHAEECLGEIVKIYTALIKWFPEKTEYYQNRGRAYLDLKMWQKALADYDKVIALGSKDPLAFKMRALCNTELGNSANALKDIGQAIRLAKPEDRDSYYFVKGQIYHESLKKTKSESDYKNAVQSYKKAIAATADKGFRSFISSQLDQLHSEYKGKWK